MKVQIVVAATDTLYHGTPLNKAVSILTQQNFSLKPSSADPTENHIAPNLYYLSTARSISSSYFKDISFVFFELDGYKISRKHRIIPVNYFPADSRLLGSEYEDRILARHPLLSIKYVKAIHCPLLFNASAKTVFDVRTSTDVSNYYAQHVNDIHRLAVKNRIPIYFYASTNIKSVNPKYRVKHSLRKTDTKPVPLPGTSYFNQYPNTKTDPEELNKKIAKAIVRLTKHAPSPTLLKSILPVRKYLNSSKILVLSRSYPEYRVMFAPIIAKLRKNRWELRHLVAYIAAKLRYMEKGSLFLHKILGDSTAPLTFVIDDNIRRQIEYEDLEIELYLLKEYKLDQVLEKKVADIGGIKSIYSRLGGL